MNASSHLENPYVGPRPFSREDENKFFGRDREAEELASRVISHPVTVLYSQSGAGKSSLINARLIKLLEQKGCKILPLVRLRGGISLVASDQINNLFVFHTLLSLSILESNQEQLASVSLRDGLEKFVHNRSAEEFVVPHVLIFDQFEELFTFYPERWEDRRGFFDQIVETLDSAPQLRILFVLREDYLAELDPYAELLPGRLRARFRLERLRSEAALEAVSSPLELSGGVFEPGVAEDLVDNLLKLSIEGPSGHREIRQEFVDPVQLQVVCQSLWHNSRRLGRSENAVITREHLEASGNVDRALSEFYESSIYRLVQDMDIKEGVLRRWFATHLITPVGTRGIVLRGRTETGGISNAAIDYLERQRLIRSEVRGGAVWYELSSDRLIEPIKNSNERWLAERPSEFAAFDVLQARAEQWKNRGLIDTELLDAAELLEARRWLSSPAGAEVGVSAAVYSLVEASERQQLRLLEAGERHQHLQQIRLSRMRRWLITTILILILLSLSLILVTIAQRRRIRQLEGMTGHWDVSAAIVPVFARASERQLSARP